MASQPDQSSALPLASMLVSSSGSKITEDNLAAVLTAAGVTVDPTLL